MVFSTALTYALIIALLLMTGACAALIFRCLKVKRCLTDSKTDRNRREVLNRSLLEISQAVVGTENPDELYNLILEKVIEAIPNANVGSVMVKNDLGLFQCTAQKGFDDSKIKDFQIPVEDTILWKYTDGAISKTEIINDVTLIKDFKVRPMTTDPDLWSINSTIAVPLSLNGEIAGILHIDSKEKDAYSSEDFQMMEHIRSTVEIALQKFQLYRNMVMLSRYDNLTGAFNRSHFIELFKGLVDRSERYKETFSLILFDIDDLKIINDNYGHITGDQLLKTFALTTLGQIRKSDIFARWGGDEFMAVFHEISEEGISLKVGKIVESLKRQPISSTKGNTTISFSFGHAIYPVEGDNFEELLKVADNRMYVNKRKKKEKDTQQRL